MSHQFLWITGGSTSWSDSASWEETDLPGSYAWPSPVIPTTGDTVTWFLPPSTPSDISGTGQAGWAQFNEGTAVAVGTITVSTFALDTLSSTNTVVEVNGGSVTANTEIVLSGTLTTLDVSGGGQVSMPSSASVGLDNAGGSIDVSNGSMDLLGGLTTTGSITVEQGTITANRAIFGSPSDTVIGQTVLFGSGSMMHFGSGYIGEAQADHHIVTVNNGATIDSDVHLYVGDAGYGALAIDTGSVVNCRGSGVGLGSESDPALGLAGLNSAALGKLWIDSFGTLNVVGAADFGYSGLGNLLLITGATAHITGSVYEGVESSAGGTTQLTDVSDTFSVGGDWIIGDAGSHNDTIQNGATATVTGSVTIGRAAGGTGVLQISGANSELSAGADITVGAAGAGTLQVGAGALVTAGGNLNVGLNGGTGIMDIASTASVSAGNVDIFAGSTLTMEGGTLTDSVPSTVAGTFSGFGTIDSPVWTPGTVIATGGPLLIQGMANGSGTIEINATTLELHAGVDYGTNIAFGGGTLQLDLPHALHATISNFAAGDTIVLQGIVADSATYDRGDVYLMSGAVQQDTLIFSGTYSSSSFNVVPLGNQTTITYVACFASGTRIATDTGPVAIEDLREGDHVLSAFGGSVPIQWIGHRRIDSTRHSNPAAIWPIRIQAHALAHNTPSRDLYVSPEHALHFDGHLIPAHLLVNGTTITQVPRTSITYFHLELPQHDVILAENTECESYLDTNNRADFENTDGPITLHPTFTPDAQRSEAATQATASPFARERAPLHPTMTADELWRAKACAPQCRQGPLLDAIRTRLNRRASRPRSAVA